MIASPEMLEKYEELANLQRHGPPEQIMQRITLRMGGGVLTHLLEHVGDITHRMGEQATFGTGLLGAVQPKVDRCLHKLTYGQFSYLGMSFLEEVEMNFRANAEGRMSVEEYATRTFSDMEKYSEAHSRLPVYNEAQWHAREAAVSLGYRKYEECKDHLRALAAHFGSEEEWNSYALAPPDPKYRTARIRTSKRESPVEEAKTLVSMLTLSGGKLPTMRPPSEEALAILQETVRESQMKVYRGIRLTPPHHPSLMGPDKDEWIGMPPSLFDAALDLRPGDPAPAWLRKTGNDFASTSKSEKVARRYLKEGHLQILLSATVSKDSILVDLTNWKRVLGKYSEVDPEENWTYFSREKEVIVIEPVNWDIEDVFNAQPQAWRRIGP